MITYTLTTNNIWFPKQTEPVYDPQDEKAMFKFKQYWRRETERCTDGFSLANGQVKISGWLYFHTVYWKIAAYVERNGRKSRVIKTPDLRDIEWIVDGDFKECEEKGLFYNLVGSRDFGKSVIAASRAGHLYTFYDNSESVISAGAENYIKLVTDKIEEGLTNLHPIFKKSRLATDWRKEIRAGWKDGKTNQPDAQSSNSRIIMRNYEMGSNTMAANGTRPGFHLIDEEGTLPNLIGCFKDSDGCWWSGDGDKPSCLTMVTGTGGDMEVGAEAAEMFFNPEAYTMLAFDNPETGGKMGRFIAATKAKMAYKYPMKLSQYLGIKHPDLDKITILVSDEERALKEWWQPQYDKARKTGNPKAILKFKAYWPLKASDSFIVLTQNDYNVEAAKEQQVRLKNRAMEQYGVVGTPVELYHDGEKITHKFSEKSYITEFPVKTQSTDAPIMIYEFPVTDPPWGLYIAGVDPYRHDVGDSLGAVYIYKRGTSITGENYEDMFVASYAARPNSQKEWEEQSRLLIKWYNALAFCENDEMSFIRYMQNKGDDHYIADTPQWLKEVVPFSTAAQNRDKGVHSSPKTIRFYKSSFKKYLDEVVVKEVDKDGSVIKEHLGVTKVPDIMLLEEVIRNNADGNFDRERAASICIAAADKMEPIGKIGEEHPLVKSFGKKPIKGSKLFIQNRQMFKPTKRKLFVR